MASSASSHLDREARLSRISSRTDTEIFDDGKGEKRHTIYYMNIEVGRKKYYLHKRYTEFLMLHQKLCEQQYPEIEDFDFPGKVWFNNFSDAVIEYRRTRFEAYLTLLLELVNKYPPLRKEVEAFLGVPQTIDPPKRYPKTPIPGRNGRPSAGDKPLALLDDSNTAAGAEAPTGAGALLGRRPAPGRKGSFAAAPLASPTSISSSSAAPGSPPSSPSSNAHGQHHHRAPAHQANPAVTVLVYLFVYILLVGVLATAAALDPAKARNCALAILGLSFGASLLVSRAFAQAHYLQHQQQLHYKAA